MFWGFLLGAGLVNFSLAQETVPEEITQTEPVEEAAVDTPVQIEILPVEEAVEKSVLMQNFKYLEVAQEVYFGDNEEYKQIIGVINVYESPEGWGYQVVQELPDRIEYIGYGPESENYTYTIDLGSVATSTDIISG